MLEDTFLKIDHLATISLGPELTEEKLVIDWQVCRFRGFGINVFSGVFGERWPVVRLVKLGEDEEECLLRLSHDPALVRFGHSVDICKCAYKKLKPLLWTTVIDPDAVPGMAGLSPTKHL